MTRRELVAGLVRLVEREQGEGRLFLVVGLAVEGALGLIEAAGGEGSVDWWWQECVSCAKLCVYAV